MKILSRREKQKLVWFNIILFIIGIFVCLLLLFLSGTGDSFSSALGLFVGFQSTSVIVSVCLCIKLDKSWHFDAEGIVEQNWLRRRKLIQYSDIEAITICSAVDSHFSPICDEQGVQEAVIAIYDNRSVARSQMRPDAIFVLPSTFLSESLSCSFFTAEKLKILMDQTHSTVLISQKEYERNREQLNDIFSKRENEVLIAVSKDTAQGGFIAFDPKIKGQLTD
ncbi:MAG: hypothetical protein IKD31_03230 [Clostridia bacterium]|nr:hypothetical protein [Clostridia bacterium]